MGYCIYKICCDDCDYVYVGSTLNFTNRKYHHKSDCNNENNKNFNIKLYTTIRDNGGWQNWRMVCIEELGDVSKRQAEIQEERWRVELNANLNSHKPYTTEEQKKEQKKENWKKYYENDANKESCKNRAKEIYNRKGKTTEYVEHKMLYDKEYRKKNKEKLIERKKGYYEKNRDKISEKSKEKITCDCGCSITKSSLSNHKKSKKHQAWEWRQNVECDN